jgi:hypothetical protein
MSNTIFIEQILKPCSIPYHYLTKAWLTQGVLLTVVVGLMWITSGAIVYLYKKKPHKPRDTFVLFGNFQHLSSQFLRYKQKEKKTRVLIFRMLNMVYDFTVRFYSE